MTGEEAKAALLKIKEWGHGDPEAAHSAADDVLRDLLRDLGYGDVIEAWDSIDKWYA